MIAGINFGNKNSYADFGLLLTGRKIGAAEVKRKTLNIPGRDGVIDYTAAFGRPFYEDRELEFDFKLIDRDTFYTTYTELAEYLHGQKMRVSLEEDPAYYYDGRCEVSDLDISKYLGKITVTVHADTYKYSKASSTEDIPWDEVDFENTVFRYIDTLNVDSSLQITIPKGGVEVVPVFNVTSFSSETFKVKANRENVNHNLTVGRNRFPKLTVCGASDVKLTFTGTGVVSIDYREARL